jgi:hypothetical protein
MECVKTHWASGTYLDLSGALAETMALRQDTEKYLVF